MNPSDGQQIDRLYRYADVPEEPLPAYVPFPRNDLDDGQIRWRLSGWKGERTEDGAVWRRTWSSCHGRALAAVVTLYAPPLRLACAAYAPISIDPWRDHRSPASPFAGLAYRRRLSDAGLSKPTIGELAVALAWCDRMLWQRINAVSPAPDVVRAHAGRLRTLLDPPPEKSPWRRL